MDIGAALANVEKIRTEYHASTPKEINADILRLCEKIGSYRQPVYLTVKPEPWCKTFSYFQNIEEKIMAKTRTKKKVRPH